MIETAVQKALAAPGSLVRCVVREVREDGLVEVETPAPERRRLLCQILLAGDGGATVDADDEVLVSLLTGDGADGIVLGRIGTLAPREECEARTIAAKQIIIEAGEELVLRCGKGSVRIQEDGKVVIRGENVLNRARETMRIKGGSVGIN